MIYFFPPMPDDNDDGETPTGREVLLSILIAVAFVAGMVFLLGWWLGI